MTPEDTFLMIGGSPYLNIIKDELPYMIDRIPSIGINVNALTFHTTHCAYVDKYLTDILVNLDKRTYIITTSFNIWMSKLFNGSYKEAVIGNNKETSLIKNGAMVYYGFTHDLALTWCALNNIKNVILVGSADFCSDEYFHNQFKFTRSKTVEDKSIDAIENIYSKYLNIYTMNPESRLNVPRITIEEVLKI